MKRWWKTTGRRPEELAANMGIALSTLHSLFKNRGPLDKRTELSLKQLGYQEPETPILPQKVAK